MTNQLTTYLRAGYPGLCIVTPEEARAEALVDGVKQFRAERSAELVARARAAGAEAGLLMARGSIERLRDEIQGIELALRTSIPESIRKAREHGDLSENAEYDAAKEKQSHLEGRIAQMEDRLARAQVIDPTGQTPDVVRFGATVVVRDAETAEEKTYRLVGEDEADASSGLISISSPVARALVGKSVDSDVQVRVPKGLREFEILEIRYD